MACNFVSGGDCGVDGVGAAVPVSRWRGRLIQDVARADDSRRPLGRIVCGSHGELQIGLDRITRASLIGDTSKNKGGIKAAFLFMQPFRG